MSKARFAMKHTSGVGRANSEWAIRNRYPFRTRGALWGTTDAPNLYYSHQPGLRVNRFAAKYDRLWRAGQVEYVVYGDWGRLLAFYANREWTLNSSEMYRTPGEVFRRAVDTTNRRICEVL